MSQFKAPEPTKSEEKELEQAMTSMVTLMSRIYKNQVILEMNQTTIDKFADRRFRDSSSKVLVERTVKFIDGYRDYSFYEGDELISGKSPILAYRDKELRIHPKEIITGNDRLKIFTDAQTGNYGVVLTDLANKANKSLVQRFSNKRIEKLVKKLFKKSDGRSKRLFYESISKQIGIDSSTLLSRDGMTYDFNALVIETTQWAQKLRDETLEMYTANTLRGMTLGQSINEILEQYDGMVEKRKNHAKFTARNQIANFNSIMNKTRAQKLGITKAVWVTSKDERVRECHRVRDGKEFELDKGLYSSCDQKWLLPGTDYQCRCGYRMLLPDDEV